MTVSQELLTPAEGVRIVPLREFPIFSGLDANEEALWGAQCTTRHISAGEILVDYGDVARDVFLIQSGQVRAVLRFSIGKEAILGSFQRGEIVGEMSAIDDQTRSASLMAMCDCTVVAMPVAVFRDILKRNHEVSMALLRLQAKRIRQLNGRISDLSFLDTKHRLYNTLLRLSRTRMSGSHERVISPPIVHSELAEHIGSSRETVSREMSRLTRENLVERTTRAIIIRNPSELSSRISKALAV
jgi:CRP/FNR family cyclic AMP-dependent transcriptional regulator